MAVGTARAAAEPQVYVDINPVITAAFIHDRYDLLIRGRVVSTTRVDEVDVILGDTRAGRIRFGDMGREALISLPDGARGSQYVFHVNLQLRHEQTSRVCECMIVVRSRKVALCTERLELAISPDQADPVRILAGPAASRVAQDHARPPIVLYAERAAVDQNGQVLVRGWAVSLTRLRSVQVFAGETCLGAARLGLERHDVGTVFPAYPDARASGFLLSATSAVPEGALRIVALDSRGSSHEATLPVERVADLYLPLGSSDGAVAVGRGKPLTPEGSGILHVCESLTIDGDGCLSAEGWAVCPAGILSVSVHLDGKEVGQAEWGLPRDDVGDNFRDIPMAANAGYRFSKSLGRLAGGDHSVRIVVRGAADDTQEAVRTITCEGTEARHGPSSQSQRFRVKIDTPAVVLGAATDPVTGRLSLEGWALARSGVDGIDVFLDDKRLGAAHYGLTRQDVEAAFPGWTGALRSGFAFRCPTRSLRDGSHTVRLRIRARNGQQHEHRFSITVDRSEDAEDSNTIRSRISQGEAEAARDVLNGLHHRPAFRLILRLDSPRDIPRVLSTLTTLSNQVYRHWNLQILATSAETSRDIRERLVDPERAGQPVEVCDAWGDPASNRPVGTAAAGEFVGLLSPGDQLGCDALLQVAVASGINRGADLLYADEMRTSPASGEREAFFKPDFSPDLLMSTNYIGRPWFAASALIRRCRITVGDLLRSGEYDAILRCSERAKRIVHVPRLLCVRGVQQIDAPALEAAALARAARRRSIRAEIVAGAVPGTWRFRRSGRVTGKVSIIIPTCAAHGHIETCIKSLRERTAYRDFEIVCVENIPDDRVAWKPWLERHADRVVQMSGAFNWSRFNNRGAEVATGDYLLFLNDDTEVTNPDWLQAMLEHMQRPEVAIVGPQLLYPDNKVQHAGMFLAGPATARHAFRFAAADEPGYFGLALTQRNVIAVTGACMLMRRSTFHPLGEFDEAHDIINNDLDFCLRAHAAGQLVVFTPFASLIHHEAASRGRVKESFDHDRFHARWRTVMAAGDPYFSPRLAHDADDYRPDEEPAENVFSGHPICHRRDIKRILVVKVDHIGDFFTAIPAIRRLKEIFPSAGIHVLASRAVRAFADMEPSIDAFSEFEFFHPVSALGPRQIGPEEYRALRERLAPYRFDLAVDLRKHPDTRQLLRFTSARFLAGYDSMGRFPFLDIALEWEGDKHLLRKRTHVADDLVNLVEAIGTACASEPARLPVPATTLPSFLPEQTRALFTKPVVAVHPGVGNVMRQWPAEYFASLIALLVDRNAVNVVLIGGPEEQALAESVLAMVRRHKAVTSLAGKTSLQQLAELLPACVLYIGNNSGPKHIAAALGVPTIGIHSGVVDAIEWGPVGRRAVAVRRNMTCSPCYLSRLEDCPRNFGCMRGLHPAAVHEVAQRFLARPVGPRIVQPVVDRAASHVGNGRGADRAPPSPGRSVRRQASPVTAQ